MATLTNTKIKDTYVGLLKTTDNQAIDASGVTLVEDGAGNASALSVGRSGNGVTITGSLNATLATAAQPNITSVGTLSSLTVSGNVNIDSNTLFVDSTANQVGINTNTPSREFEVTGAGNVYLKVSAQTDNDAAALELANTQETWTIINQDLNDDALEFSGSTNGTALTIKKDGNVGIGTSSPDATIVVEESSVSQSAQANDIAVFKRNGDGYLKIYNPNSNIGGISFGDTDDPFVGAIRYQHSTDHLDFVVNNAERMRIGSSGIVNIAGGVLELASQAEIIGSTDNLKISADPDNVSGSSTIEFLVDGSEKMRIDNAGNVGIGTPSPLAKLHIASTNAAITDPLAVGNTLRFTDNDSTQNNGQITGTIEWETKDADNAGIQAYITSVSTNTGLGNLAFATGAGGSATERMRITSDGQLLINNTSYNGAADLNYFMFNNGSGTAWVGHETGTSSGTAFVNFRYAGGQIGSITQSGTTAVAYNTTSDYRLKENVVEMTGALDRVDALKPSRFNFIGEDRTVDGFLAHEVAEVVPEAVTGEKDGMRDEEYEVSPAVYEDVVHPAVEAVYETIEHPAIPEEVDEEGNVIIAGQEAYTEQVLVSEAKEEWTERVLVSEAVMGTRSVPDYQGIDQSKIVPLLVGAIKELSAKVATLESQINA